MKFIHRVGYYLGGFSIGLVLLAFFLSGKKTSCDYSPNARTVKNISIKKRFYSEAATKTMKTFNLDTLAISKLIKTGNVNFSESDTKSEGCKTYLIENKIDNKDIKLLIKNCDSIATINSIIIK
ncbi:hypothetical protein [Ichthyenterobacterium magnum]|uniref:DUF4258 domain-containing protein n=1 Tax=Ichthyenterobacterium magnum TaxID=1230530 RepID=A0A420DM01_9FLAO|nr:hypothetical protein [Ichthyenterobacterium magnum]RKE95316.1 hypothetical protein BXY80_1503 [Ichthyenterobacterium magnum]